MTDESQLDLDAARSSLAMVANDDAQQLAEDLQAMAVHMSGRIHYTEGRLSNMAGLGAALVAFGTAILSLISALGQNVSWWFGLAVLLFSVSSILSGLIVWYVYARQTNFDYAFKGVSGPRLWFYRDAIPSVNTFKIPRKAYREPESSEAVSAKAHIREEFVEQWPDFARYVGSVLTDPREYALENLRQVYLLHYNEFYKNKFLTHLRTVLGTLIRWVLIPELLLLMGLAVIELVLS